MTDTRRPLGPGPAPALSREADARGIILAAPLPYAAILGTVQCLALARDTRGEAETLRAKLWPHMDAAGVATPQEARVPCDVLRAATLCLRRWRADTGTTLWGDADDVELTAAWRDGLNAPRPTP
ncbi:hypothetical protein, partial [Streptomyces sp. NBC_00280]|uniref:hypothetical protein n=1 Tax=Streptomyces sp. NBC_00280 TaxID=2975699 RepID=UPI00352CEB3A